MADWEADLLGPQLHVAGVPLSPRTKTINFVDGVTGEYNPTTGAMDLTVAGGGGRTPSLMDILDVGNAALGFRITDLEDPVDPQDAATKAYVDAHSSAQQLAVSVETLAARTLTADDAQTYLRCTNAAGCVLTVNSGVFAEGDWLLIRQVGAGAVSFAGTATLTAPVTKALTTAQQGGTIALVFTSASAADVMGDLSDA